MKRSTRFFGAYLAVGVSVWCMILLIGVTSLQAAPNPDKIMGPNACGECHASEMKAWQNTHHFRTFSELHRRENAREIQEKLGLRRIKSESDCMSCHYTVSNENDKHSAIAGISCESCHGAAADWIDLHNKFGGPDVAKKDESPANRVERLAKTSAAGMIRPDQLYELAQNCYQCHTVPNEKLVNVGGHKAGSDFELVSWLQGEVRHNFTAGDGTTNAESSPERKRMLYIVGRALDLEFALRGVAKATEKAGYAIAMAKRAKRAIANLKEIAALVSLDELNSILEIAEAQKLKLNNEEALTAAADRISELTRAIAGKNSGSALAAIDPLIPGADSYKGAASE